MIIVKLAGGLGNQMFQYAAGKALADRMGTELKLDVSFLVDKTPRDNFTYREFELDKFNIDADIISEADLSRFLRRASYFEKFRIGPLSRKIFKAQLPIPTRHLEKTLRYNGTFENISTNTMIEGFWQSERYFKSVEKSIRKDFSIRDSLKTDITFKHGNNDIEHLNSISVHVRRGDYAQNQLTNKVHGLCGLDYYLEAMTLAKNRVAKPVFFIFSDDPDWAFNTFKSYESEFDIQYVINSKMPHFDLLKMSSCKHNIIANSSFSWWGSWLNENEDKIVVAPKKWFADKNLNEQTTDLIPEKWIRL